MRFWESKWLAQVYTVEEDGHFLNQKMDILIPKLHTLIKKDQFTLSIKVTNRLCDIRYTCTIWILLLGFYEGKGGRQCLKYKGMGSKTARGFSSVQSLSRVWLFVTPWPAAHQASLSITNSQSLLNSCPSSQWSHPTISSSVVPFSSCHRVEERNASPFTIPQTGLCGLPW